MPKNEGDNPPNIIIYSQGGCLIFTWAIANGNQINHENSNVKTKNKTVLFFCTSDNPSK